MMHFLAMGGYARFVWPAFALALVVMMLNIVWARGSLRAAQAEARRRVLSMREAYGTAPQDRGAQR
ncbi:MAG TPA: heme exporter protein CcmD [Steroidobacteraceae bacterium]|nr:heme exporter protein CcmD [Steroidobacteraceae bacterium]